MFRVFTNRLQESIAGAFLLPAVILLIAFSAPTAFFGNSSASAESPQESCEDSGGVWEVQGVEGGIPGYGCSCPNRQFNGRCTGSQEEFECITSGGVWEDQNVGGSQPSDGCSCPTGQEVNEGVCRLIANTGPNSASACKLRENFLGIPTWYRGLVDDSTCEIVVGRDDFRSARSDTNPALIIATNVIAILSRLAGIIVVIFIVVGGFKYVLSDGDPQKTAEARKTIINALIGALIVAVAATVIEIIYSTLT